MAGKYATGRYKVIVGTQETTEGIKKGEYLPRTRLNFTINF
jgi:hypothetical protein